MPYQDGPYSLNRPPPPAPLPGYHLDAQGRSVPNTNTCHAHFDAQGRVKKGKVSPIPGTRFGVDPIRGCVYIDVRTGRVLSPLEEAQATGVLVRQGRVGTPQASSAGMVTALRQGGIKVTPGSYPGGVSLDTARQSVLLQVASGGLARSYKSQLATLTPTQAQELMNALPPKESAAVLAALPVSTAAVVVPTGPAAPMNASPGGGGGGGGAESGLPRLPIAPAPVKSPYVMPALVGAAILAAKFFL